MSEYILSLIWEQSLNRIYTWASFHVILCYYKGQEEQDFSSYFNPLYSVEVIQAGPLT